MRLGNREETPKPKPYRAWEMPSLQPHTVKNPQIDASETLSVQSNLHCSSRIELAP